MNRSVLQVVIASLAVLWIAGASMFQVKETELAIKFRLKKIIVTDFEPGLQFMVPLLESVQKFDRRVLTRNYPAEPFLTSEGKFLNVDFYVKWRISDVERYYLATNGDEEAAASRLGEIVKDGLKGVIAKRTIQQVVAAERAEFIGYEAQRVRWIMLMLSGFFAGISGSAAADTAAIGTLMNISRQSEKQKEENQKRKSKDSPRTERAVPPAAISASARTGATS